MRKESTSRARLPSPQGVEQKALVRYKQDLAEFLPIADGARLIQERAGLTEDEAREDIVAAIRDRVLAVRWFRVIQGERRECYRSDLPHGFLDNLTPSDIDWETSIARRRSIYSPFTVEIEVSRDDLERLWREARRATEGCEISSQPTEVPDQSEGKQQGKKDRPGRPSHRVEIADLFGQMLKAGKADITSRKANFEQIRGLARKARSLGPQQKIKGFGDDVIGKVIGPIIDGLNNGPSATG